MSTFFDYKKTFSDTHRNFRLVLEMSRNVAIVCEGLELKKSNFKNKTCLDTQPMNDKIDKLTFGKVFSDHL